MFTLTGSHWEMERHYFLQKPNSSFCNWNSEKLRGIDMKWLSYKMRKILQDRHAYTVAQITLLPFVKEKGEH
jgi:hypothetical protein